jgi:type II secretory pathway component PulK
MKTTDLTGSRMETKGSVLILALWVLCFLSTMVIAVASGVWSNMAQARYLEDRISAYYVARAGVETAMFEVSLDTNSWDSFDEEWHGNEAGFRDIALGRGRFSVFHLEGDKSGGTVTNYGLRDEQSKFNINSVTNPAGRAVFRCLLETAAGVDTDIAELIAARVSDWIDPDQEPLEEGSEVGASGLPCRNSRMVRVEELLLVEGVTTNILADIRDHVTVHGADGRINLNTAGETVLMSIAGARKDAISEEAQASLVKRILQFRKDGGVLPLAEKREIKRQLYGETRIPGNRRAEWVALEWLINHRMLTVQSRHFCGISVGKVEDGSPAERRIVFVYDRQKDEIRAWSEN